MITSTTSKNDYWIDNILSNIVLKCIELNPTATHAQILGLCMRTLRGRVDGRILDLTIKECLTITQDGST